MRNVCIALLLLVAFTSFSQKAPAKFGSIPMEDMQMKIYPLDSSASAVVLVDYGESTIKYTQNVGFQIVFERLRRIKILNKDGLKFGDFSIPLYHDSDQEEIVSGLKVVTYNLENGKIVEAKVKGDSFMKEKYDANTTFMKVAWTNAKEGSILEVAYTVTSDFLFNFQDWDFQTTIPTRWSEYRASIPEYYNYEKYMQGYVSLNVSESKVLSNSFTVNYSNRNTGSFGATTQTSFEHQTIEYQENRFRWAAKDVPAFKKEPFMSNSRDYISRLNFELAFTKFPQTFSNPGVKQYMGSWQDINKTYLKRVGDEISGNNSLKDEVEKITVGATTPDQKVSAIHSYVKQNVVWNEEYRSYPSQSAKKTFETKKGNSSEINFLLACMLDKAGITVNPVLLSTRDHGFVREATPISSQFNYVACLVKQGEKSILLDATDKYLPLGMLPEQCLNGQGLVVSEADVQWVNLQPLTKSRTIYNTDLTLNEAGELNGSIKIERTGYNSADARKSYLLNGEQEYLKTFTKGRSWTLAKSVFQNTKELDQSFKEIHDVTISEHTSEAGGTIYLSPFILAKADENPFKLEKRIYPVQFDHAFDEMYLAKITIPNGYTIDEMPKPKIVMLPENAARYSYNATLNNNVINITSSLVVNKSLFNQEEYPNLREFFSQLVAKQAEQIVLKKKQ